ncbi:guanylate kinase [Enterococcus sp. DIV0840]|uniref:guanylate kinase n=1 Tax=Enterococcus TaxID=1350 RepID=UPI001A8E1520|nr:MULTISPECIES: guanylate kinase [Enterococcus]MBO0435241.1 guanylate kinase [Enterococcus sp. DIV0849a]MBO0474461.1 guanylate kinase [Enterococcus ureasiticus]
MKRKELKHPFFVIIGPSGSGKTKVAEAVFPSEYKVISHTTRPIRKEEEDGLDYYFETKERFEYLLNTEALAEHDMYHGNQYGVGIVELLQKTADHYAYDVLTIKGFQEIEKKFGNMVIPIFLNVSKKNVLTRLKIREDDEKILTQRGALYDQEIQNKNMVVNYPNYYIIDADQSFEKVVKDVKQAVNETVKIKLG